MTHSQSHTALAWRELSDGAPKDGSEILGYRRDAGILLIRYIAAIDFLTDTELEDLDQDASEKPDWFYADFVSGGRLEGDECPTHWMPLPPPPGTEPPQSINSGLLEAAKSLSAKLKAIHDDARYKSVWQIAQLHSYPYDGPTYVIELDNLDTAISNAEKAI